MVPSSSVLVHTSDLTFFSAGALVRRLARIASVMVCVAGLGIVASPHSVAAQETPPRPASGDLTPLDSASSAVTREALERALETQSGDTRTTRDRLLLADQYLDAGRIDAAIALLEDAVTAEPENRFALRKLLDAYVAVRRYEEALATLNDAISRLGASTQRLAERGALLYRLGRQSEAENAWAQAVALRPEAPDTYQHVAEQQATLSLYARAASTLETSQNRELIGDAQLIQIGSLYGMAAEYRQAAEAYARFLLSHPDRAPLVQARLFQLVGSEGAPEAIAEAMQEAVRENPFNVGLREIQAWLALEQDNPEAALDATLALDRITNDDGNRVFAFARQAIRRGDLDVAVRAFSDLRERHPHSPLLPVVTLEEADLALRRVEIHPNTDSLVSAARSGYRAFLDANPSHPAAPRARRALADLALTIDRDPDEAQRLLEVIVASDADPRMRAQARFDLADVDLQRGDLYEARRRFEAIEQSLRTGALADQARFELAQIDFYEGYFFSALGRVEAIDDNTAADAANDALSLRVTLSENIDPDSTADALSAFARASLLLRRGRPQDAVTILDSLDAVETGHPILDDAAFLQARALRDAERSDDAARHLLQLARQAPDSFFADRALMLRADILETNLADIDAASEAYRTLLERYPGSLFADEARTHLRRLRGDTPPS